MKPKKILVVFGTRPEAIKMAPVVHALRKDAQHFSVVTCVTAQHREMLDQVLSLFGIVPDIDLNLMTPNQTLAGLTASALTAVTRVIERVQPDWVLVQGDTTTAMVTALASFYQKIPVGHVEAGLRTYDPYRPFPEEINRHMIASLASLHFAPTEYARQALIKEGVAKNRVFRTGNTVVDALLEVVEGIKKKPIKLPRVNGHRMILVTAHRRENFDEPLENICLALNRIVEAHQDVEVVYPVHLNPNVKGPVERLLAKRERVRLIGPVAYRELVGLMHASYLILTDSGGIQEEAPALGKPVLVMREKTERPEGVQAGVTMLVGTDSKRIIKETTRLLTDEKAYRRMAQAVSPYGDGRAAGRIAEILKRKTRDQGPEIREERRTTNDERRKGAS